MEVEISFTPLCEVIDRDVLFQLYAFAQTDHQHGDTIRLKMNTKTPLERRLTWLA